MTRSPLRLSQSQLNLLERCPRKFQYTYLDEVIAPASPDEIARQQWGSQFHLTMQQRELGVLELGENAAAIDAKLSNEKLSNEAAGSRDIRQNLFHKAVEALVAALPDVFDGTRAVDRHSEHRRSLSFDGYLLTVVYDLVVLGDGQAQILDWKTYRKPQQRSRLMESWQTRLYPFVLAETTDYQPEDISMTYWFISPRPRQSLQSAGGSRSSDSSESDRLLSLSSPEFQPIQPESITFNYSSPQHDTVRQQLHELLVTLTQHLEAADRHSAVASTPYRFPQIPEQGEVCPTCPYALRCGRSPQADTDAWAMRQWLDVTPLTDIDSIEEIPL